MDVNTVMLAALGLRLLLYKFITITRTSMKTSLTELVVSLCRYFRLSSSFLDDEVKTNDGGLLCKF